MRGLRRTAALLAFPAMLLGFFFAVPLARTFEAAFASVEPWTWAFTHPYVRNRVGTAFLQAGLSVALTLILALPLAWAHHRYRLPFGRLQMAIHAAPFVLPVFVIVFGVQAVLGSGGWTERALGWNVLATVGPLGAVVIAHAYYNYGFAARLFVATLERRPHRLEEAAQTLGASRLAAFRRVTLPLLLPSITSVALLVFLFAFTSFGVVLYMGADQVDTLETLLYENLGGGFPRYGRAAVLGIMQLAANLVLLAGYHHLRGRAARIDREPRRDPTRAGPVLSMASGLVLLGGLSPAVAVLLGGFQVGGEWSLEPWRALTDPSHPAHLGGFDLGHAIGRSLLYAAASTVTAVALTLLLAYGLRRVGGPWRGVVEVAAALPLGTSSLLIGFGYLLAFGAGSLLDLRGSIALIVLAHTLVAFPFTARALLPALDQHDVRLDEAAYTLGAPPLDIARRIHWPLLRNPLLAAAGFAAAISLGDFGASLLLMRPDNMAVSIWIDRHGGIGTFNPLARAQAVALSGVLLILAAGAYLVIEAFRKPGEAEFA